MPRIMSLALIKIWLNKIKKVTIWNSLLFVKQESDEMNIQKRASEKPQGL